MCLNFETNQWRRQFVGILGLCWFSCKEKVTSSLSISFWTTWKFSKKTCIEEIQTVLRENYVLEFWDKSTKIEVLPDRWDNNDSNSRSSVPNKLLPKNSEITIQILMWKNQAFGSGKILTRKTRQIKENFFWGFHNIGLWIHRSDSCFFKPVVLLQSELFNWDLDLRNLACGPGEQRVRFWRGNKNTTFRKLRIKTILMQRN